MAVRPKEVWKDNDSYTTTLVAMFLDMYGTEGLSWDPTTCLMEVQDDMAVVLPPIVADRLLAGIQLLKTDAFYCSLPDFIAFCNVLSGTPNNPEMWDPADVYEISWGITEAMLLAPPDNEDEPFTEEIRAYIGQMVSVAGIISPPDVLRLALRDSPELTGQVNAEYSDDPLMFQAIYAVEQAKTDDITRMLKENLGELLDQLTRLPLRSGSTRDLIARLQKESPSLVRK